MRSIRGASVCVSIGVPCRPALQWCRGSHLRIVFFFVSVIFAAVDLDLVIGLAMKDVAEREVKND